MSKKPRNVSIHWRKPVENPRYTEQELAFISWLDELNIPYGYEQVSFIKNSPTEKLLHKVVDFVFSETLPEPSQNNDDFFVIELTDRKRPNIHRPNSRQRDPKKETRHLARLADVVHAILYRGELPRFKELFIEVKNKYFKDDSPNVDVLEQTVFLWNEIEWK
jgi:hypothetical protein